MDYTPSSHDIELMRFFNLRGQTINYLKKLNIETPYLSRVKTYDQLLSTYVMGDISRTEMNYLLEGIENIFQCINSCELSPELTYDQAKAQILLEHREMIENAKNDGNKVEWIETHTKGVLETYNRLRNTAIETLIKEFAEFKIRLGRVNIDVRVKDNKIEFERFGELLSDMSTIPHILIENPYPQIFSGLSAYNIFKKLHDIFEANNSHLADYSYIYREMYKDGLIIDKVKSGKFRDWLIDTFDLKITAKLKTIDNCHTPLKENVYKTIKSIR